MKNKTIAIDDDVIDELTGLINSFIEFNKESNERISTTNETTGVKNNKMTYTEFENILTAIYELNLKKEEYSDKMIKLDPAFSTYLVESPLLEFTNLINDKLMTALFSDKLEDVIWFLYDWRKGLEIEVNGKKYIINNLEDYLDYVKEVYYSPEPMTNIFPEL